MHDATTYIERYPRPEERVNAATHGVAALLSVVGLVFLALQADAVGKAGSVPAVIVYGLSMIFLFVFSATHHAVVQPRIKRFLLALDHSGIYLLIAGTYTPFCLLMPPGQEWLLFGIVWGLAFTGIAVQVLSFLTGYSDLYERFAFVFYLALGWIPMVWTSGDVAAKLAWWGFALIFAGGLAYSIGVIFYLWKRLPYGHAVWHLFVVGGCAFHFFAIFHHVIPVA